MQNPMGDMVIADHVKNLSFINVPGIGPGMENPIGINGKGLPVAGLRISVPSDPVPAKRRKAGKKTLLLCVKPLFNIQQL
jgi:hypothetical protein